MKPLWIKHPDSPACCLESHPSSATYCLCDLRQLTQPLCVFPFPVNEMGMKIKHPPYGAIVILNIFSSPLQSKLHVNVSCDCHVYFTGLELLPVVISGSGGWGGGAEGLPLRTLHIAAAFYFFFFFMNIYLYCDTHIF